MRTIRFPIAGLMLAVLVVALGLAALRNASEVWAGVMFLFTCAVLCLAIVGAICRDGPRRAWWLGFALFGWGYLLLSLWSKVNLPTMALLDAIASWLRLHVRFSGVVGEIPGTGHGGGRFGGFPSVRPLVGGFGRGGGAGLFDEQLHQIAHCLCALVAALLGGLLARTLFGGPNVSPEIREAHVVSAESTSRRWWLFPAIVGLAGCAVVMSLGVFGSKTAPGVWVGAAFLLTCGLLGAALLGAAGDRGKRRQVWLGAAIFGIGYMAMAFGRSLDGETRPILPTDYMLLAVRHWFPPTVTGFPTATDGVVAANARIWNALEQPVPMHFYEDTPLEDVLKHIKAATRGPNGKGIDIFVDPIGLQEAEKSMTSTVRNVELDGVPLKTSLRLCVDQLDLTYRIRDGYLLITSKESAIGPVYQDPFLIFGHCLLALLAAAFGGIVSPLFANMRPRPPSVN
jgi:hypothetical protein